MNAIDFQYDDLYLSDFGYMICTFDSGNSPETISMGSEITFTQSPVSNGRRFMITSASYDSCIEAEFSICKDPEYFIDYEDRFFTIEEQQELMRWLNRTEMCKFAPVEDDRIDIFYEGSFNLSKIELNGDVIGMSLHFISNRPFGFGTDITHDFSVLPGANTYIIRDASDEIGYTYPSVKIKINVSGDLTIKNDFDGRQTIIKNCVNGETITMKNMIIESSDSNHQKTIMNDFNFLFPRICNSYDKVDNKFEFSLSCDVEMVYQPIRKVGI